MIVIYHNNKIPRSELCFIEFDFMEYINGKKFRRKNETVTRSLSLCVQLITFSTSFLTLLLVCLY
jgi:hypothetical protein